jgi:hypothetical protein
MARRGACGGISPAMGLRWAEPIGIILFESAADVRSGIASRFHGDHTAPGYGAGQHDYASWPIQQRSATGRFLALKKTSRGVR